MLQTDVKDVDFFVENYEIVTYIRADHPSYSVLANLEDYEIASEEGPPERRKLVFKPKIVERVVDGQRFRFSGQRLNEFRFWFEGQFKFTINDGKVNYQEDTGMCGKDALRTRWVSVVNAMSDKCNAEYLGPVQGEASQPPKQKRGRRKNNA